MNSLTPTQYDTLTQGAEVIERDAIGARVFILTDKTYLKLFRAKKLFSSDTLFPYALRFANNAKVLQTRGIPTVTVLDIARIKHLKSTSVHYQPIPGRTLRSLGGATGTLAEEVIQQFAVFVAGLHDQGIYFRSFHLGNVIVMENGQFGLIDIADLWTKKKPLVFKDRMRNFSRIYRFSDDIELLRSAGDTVFVDHYLKTVQVNTSDAWRTQLQEQQEALLKTRRSTRG